MAVAALPRLPRRDPASRAHLENAARQARPVVLAGERRLAVGGELGAQLPRGGVQRGSVVSVVGAPGGGATSVVLDLVAAAHVAGEWAAAVCLDETLGGVAAQEHGVDLSRFAVVRRIAPDQWATVVGALLDGVGMVVTEVPRAVRLSDARRLLARARERDAVLVPIYVPLPQRAVVTTRWPIEAALRLDVVPSPWSGLGAGWGRLEDRIVRVRVEGRGAPLAQVG